MSKKSSGEKLKIVAVFFNGLFVVMKIMAKRRKEGKNIDDENPYLAENHIQPAEKQTNRDIKARKSSINSPGVYEKLLKPTIDTMLSFLGLVFLAPVFAFISIAIFIDDPGPIFFTQKRVGKDKKFFYLHKFRSMKMSTPHDVPTHLLSDPEQYITRVGRVLRKTSLDEIPQIWDIFQGKMSIIGPRPALWNQEDLVEERDKYSANNVFPGLTGWAQINGRDEVEISDKANLDGEYVRHLRRGGIDALLFDMKCFIGTIRSVVGGDGVVEGGTGEIHKRKTIGRDSTRVADARTEYEIESIDSVDAGFEDYGYRKNFVIDTSESNCKRVLITGANSYIGESFETYAREHYGKNFVIDTVDMIGDTWKEKDFSSYDCVLHVAGIAHVNKRNIDEETKVRYYAVNTELAIDTARKAKAEGVSQFVFMSSMSIYGEAAPFGKQKFIDEHTHPAPANFYGDSKWQADKSIRKLCNEKFRVAVLRPPMIYGKGCKGNYQILSALAKRFLVFPNINNKHSMLYIENLCEFLCLLILSKESGIYFPQNEEYTKTADMVRGIAKAVGQKNFSSHLLNPAVTFASYIPGKVSKMINKAFGDSIYAKNISVYNGLEYQVIDLWESIQRTEK